MAEDSGQEKTEDPTPKRLKESREKGEIPRSKETQYNRIAYGFSSSSTRFWRRSNC